MEHEELQVVYAGFWIRALATAIDTVILLVLVTLPLTLTYGVHDYWYGEEYFLGFWDVMLGYVMPVIFTIWFWLRYQGTPGKILLKLQIVDAKTMATLTLRQAVVRYLGYFLSILVILMGFFWIAFDQRKQAWHDKLAGSVVIVKPQ
jgi:uncharacterized RDD family membrane protein YckC